MALRTITRDTLDLLYQSVRLPGVHPGAVPPGRGAAADPSDPGYGVCDDLVRVVRFTRVDEGPFARQFSVRTSDPIDEPPFTARGATTPWEAGVTAPFGEELRATGTRFKKVGLTVRVDELMTSMTADDVLTIQVRLARIAIVRALSEALLFSDPPDDDVAELAGLPFFLPAGSSQDVTYQPARGLMGGVSELIARVRPGDDGLGAGPCGLVMTSRCAWRLATEMEEKGLQPDIRHSALLDREVMHFRGVPVMGGRLPEPAVDPPTTEVWALKLTGPSAVRVLHVEGDEWGLREEPPTTTTGLDAGEATSATRSVEVYGVYAVHVPDPRSIARLSGVPAGDPFSQP